MKTRVRTSAHKVRSELATRSEVMYLELNRGRRGVPALYGGWIDQERVYYVVQRVSASLVRCRLETGRTHQIRVHLRAISHPVVGDRDYDGGRPGLDPGRPFLHAAELRFRHPITDEPMAFESPLPADLTETLARCR